jgi:hypothetical protein
MLQNRDQIAPLNCDGNAPSCPVSFTQEEAELIDALDDLHRDADSDLERINEFLGLASGGWTPN